MTSEINNTEKITRDSGAETAVLAGGCFWGMQDPLRRRSGVLGTRVGYTGVTPEQERIARDTIADVDASGSVAG